MRSILAACNSKPTRVSFEQAGGNLGTSCKIDCNEQCKSVGWKKGGYLHMIDVSPYSKIAVEYSLDVVFFFALSFDLPE